MTRLQLHALMAAQIISGIAASPHSGASTLDNPFWHASVARIADKLIQECEKYHANDILP